MTNARPSRLARAAALVAAVAAAGCASEDYSYARESRFDRPYRGGAASAPTERPRPTGDANIASGVGFLVQVLACVFDGPGR